MTRVARAMIALVAAGVPAAAIWVWLARPSLWTVTERGLVLTEQNASGRFQAVAVFTLIGVALGLVAGALVERLCRPARWTTVVALAAASLAAGLLCWQLGMAFGPPPLQETTAAVGESVAEPLAVDTIVPFLVWPLAALLSYTLALHLGSDGVRERPLESADDLSRPPPP